MIYFMLESSDHGASNIYDDPSENELIGPHVIPNRAPFSPEHHHFYSKVRFNAIHLTHYVRFEIDNRFLHTYCFCFFFCINFFSLMRLMLLLFLILFSLIFSMSFVEITAKCELK